MTAQHDWSSLVGLVIFAFGLAAVLIGGGWLSGWALDELSKREGPEDMDPGTRRQNHRNQGHGHDGNMRRRNSISHLSQGAVMNDLNEAFKEAAEKETKRNERKKLLEEKCAKEAELDEEMLRKMNEED